MTANTKEIFRKYNRTHQSNTTTIRFAPLAVLSPAADGSAGQSLLKLRDLRLLARQLPSHRLQLLLVLPLPPRKLGVKLGVGQRRPQRVCLQRTGSKTVATAAAAAAAAVSRVAA